ncbi:MAG: S1-C subfamily serine protease [Myxococcota bacterium]|jgi:S1-C subfamily serine protease
MSNFSDISNHLADLVASAAPSIVRISRGRVPASGVVWRDLGDTRVVVTVSRHFRGDEGFNVLLEDGTEHPAEVIGRDPTTDLLALKTVAPGAAAKTSHGDGLRVGELAVTVGRPGRTARATLGMISALGDAWHTPRGGLVDRWIEVDAALPGGFGGGALLSATGAVLGVNTHRLTRGGATLPSATVDRVVDTLLKDGAIRNGYLGVGVQPAATPAEHARDGGLLVTSLEAGAPGTTAGLLVGDLLLAVDGRSVAHFRELIAALAGRVGETVDVEILRGGKDEKVQVTVGERPERSRCGGRRR